MDSAEATLELLEGIADIVGRDPDLPLSQDTRVRNLQLTQGIARAVGILPPKQGDMATVTQSIGSGLDWSDVSSWEAQLDNGTYYSSGDDAVGECSAETFTDTAEVVINGGNTVGLSSVELTCGSGDEHDGTAGSGVVIHHAIRVTVDWVYVNWIELDGDSGSAAACCYCSPGFRDEIFFDHIICWGGSNSSAARPVMIGAGGSTPSRDAQVSNCIVYDGHYTSTSGSFSGISTDFNSGSVESGINNNTVYGLSNENGTVRGIYAVGTQTNDQIRNNISMNITSSGSGSAVDYSFATTNHDYNADEDGTATGANSITVTTPADEFVSVIGGMEDFHLVSGADCVDEGTDLSSTGIPRISNDIDNVARTGTWDIGADQYVAAGGGNTSLVNATRTRRRALRHA